MGRNSLISIGSEAFKILCLIDDGMTIAQIRKSTGKTYQNVQSFKQDLEKAGWIIKIERGKYQLTTDGIYFLNFIKRRK